MNQGRHKTRTPAYLKHFKCIGSPCEDNCCIGWDVDFDKKTYQKYTQVKEGELGRLFKSCVAPNPESFSDAVDYAAVRLKKNKVCPFLDERHLCKIQSRFGEDYLSNVCATYPRYTNVIDGVYEHSATVSCPEAARLILMNPAGIAFEEGEEPAAARCILTYEVNTRQRSNPPRVRHLIALRALAISVLQDRRHPLEHRIMHLGEFYETFEKETAKGGKGDVPALIAAFKARFAAGVHKPRWADISPDHTGQMALLKEITGALNVFTEIDSKRYIDFTREFLAGLGSSERITLQAQGERAAEAYRQYYAPLMETHGHILENYLVNFVFKDLFPAAEGETAFDACMMLVIRYVLIKLHLMGIAAHRQQLTEETAVGFIQAFSKTVEHHKTYLEGIAAHMTAKRYNTPRQMALLIKD